MADTPTTPTNWIHVAGLALLIVGSAVAQWIHTEPAPTPVVPDKVIVVPDKPEPAPTPKPLPPAPPTPAPQPSTGTINLTVGGTAVAVTPDAQTGGVDVLVRTAAGPNPVPPAPVPTPTPVKPDPPKPDPTPDPDPAPKPPAVAPKWGTLILPASPTGKQSALRTDAAVKAAMKAAGVTYSSYLSGASEVSGPAWSAALKGVTLPALVWTGEAGALAGVAPVTDEASVLAALKEVVK